MTCYVQDVLIVAALALKKMKISLSALIVAWGSIRKVGVKVNNYTKENFRVWHWTYKKWLLFWKRFRCVN